MNKFAGVLLSLSGCIAIQAQEKTLTEKDYQQAESMLGVSTQQYVDRAGVYANWIQGNKFWYRILVPGGSEFILVDAKKGQKTTAFDQAKLAEALSSATGKTYSAATLPFQSIGFNAEGNTIRFSTDRKQWLFNTKTNALTADSSSANVSQDRPAGMGFRGNRSPEVISPDGTKSVLIKDYNLWVKDLRSGQQKQLTTDGIKNFGYSTDNAGWKSSDRPVVRWSPDSKKVATFKQDERNVGDMYLVTTNVGHPVLKAWKYPLPGDKEIAMIHRLIIDVETGKTVMFNIPPDPHRATLSDDISSSGTFDDIDWNPDGTEVAFLSTSRDHKQEKMRIANTATGEVREIFEETVPTQYESGQGAINWRYLSATKEFIWYSERDNWGHLYLYDAATGKLKNQITKGDWVVLQVVRVDEKKRQIYFVANGLQQENPYYSQLCKIGFDGKNFSVLTPEAGTHQTSFSPDNNYIIDTWSKPDVPGITVLRDITGKKIADLEKADISRLTATGWKAPTVFSVKAHDGKTDIYGLMFAPTRIETSKKYPVVNYIYPGPQGGSVGSWAFSASRSDHQALAELGFVVVLIEGTGNPDRSKSFHDMYYPDMSTNTLPDQISGIRQLAQRYAYIDTTRVGVWGHSGGGFATGAAMLRYPEFYKVGISESGNHDNRNYEDDWGERYIGLLTKNADGTDNYTAQANQVYAKNLKGKLLLAHGLMDNNVPPYNTFLMIEALAKANKDYDLILFPAAAHGFGTYSPYMMRRRWDYFVQHLAGNTPPKEFQITMKADPRND